MSQKGNKRVCKNSQKVLYVLHTYTVTLETKNSQKRATLDVIYGRPLVCWLRKFPSIFHFFNPELTKMDENKKLLC